MDEIFEDEPEAQEARGICFPEDGNTATIEGFIGGESHDSYLVHLKKGRKLSLRLSVAQGADEGDANFNVSREEFGQSVDFGESADNGKFWTGEIPQTGVYFISVTAHPSAHYSLKVTIE
jgi:hypothetical protein